MLSSAPPPPSCLSPLQISGNREADVSEQESVIKAHLLEYKTQREAKRSPFVFRPLNCLLSVLAYLRDQEQGGLCWARDKRQAVLPQSPGGHISSCPAELYFKGKVELPF